MMMMMIKKLCIVLFFFSITVSAIAREKDFGIWYGFSAEHKLTKKLQVDLSANIRTFKKASKIDEAFIEGGLDYNFSKHLSLAGSYRLTKKIEDNNSYYYQHKMFVDLKGSLTPGNFSFSARVRLQTRTKTYIKDENDTHPDYTGRIKLKAVYKTPVFPLDPYIYVETFRPMFSALSGAVGKNRFSAGVELKIAKRNSVEVEYILQRDFQPHISDINIISVNYNIKF
jgi:hypothetical protein